MQYTRTVTDLNREITILQKELSDSRTAQQVAAAQMTEMRQTVEQLRDRLVQQVATREGTAYFYDRLIVHSENNDNKVMTKENIYRNILYLD